MAAWREPLKWIPLEEKPIVQAVSLFDRVLMHGRRTLFREALGLSAS